MKTSEWTAALRSGKYEQCQEQLNDGHGGFCCLGVLCEIAEVDKIEDGAPGTSYIFPAKIPGRDLLAENTIPVTHQDTILEDLDLKIQVVAMTADNDTCRDQQSLHDRLMDMNDHGLPFEEIADYIDEVASGKHRA